MTGPRRQAQPPLHLMYEATVAGFGAAEFEIAVQVDGGAYRVDASGETYGAAALFGDLTLKASSSGVIAGNQMTPALFGTDNVYNGDQRRTRVHWSAGVGMSDEIVPSLSDENRTPIPDDARAAALDPITALLGFSMGGPAKGKCSGQAKVYDGRRSYTLTLDNEGAATAETLTVGGKDVIALKCRIGSLRTGGKSPEGWLSSSSDSEFAEIWFLQDGSGRALPLRIEADAPIGYSVVRLAALP